ncbi:protein TALPID3 isoform X4 [Takifugu rubripes]|uniref:protein TALPID3 isoform X3 n=1 Tax=Takifugu rubripes TaxID=31033 RepID=UPI001145F594|nr:protein TALPID3 isoform X3 [Takifugu rubripes]XP_029688836.1 protein TALPID3 isoform X4 [Takifugu rubripes]
MKSGTARKVQDLRPPAVDQQRLSKGEKRRQDRQKPSPVPAVHSAEPAPDRELLTSRFATGSRGFVLAALKQRSQHALEKAGPPSEERQPPCYLGNGINRTDPLKPVMDTRVSQLRDDTPRLLQRGGFSRSLQMLDNGQNQQLQSSVSRQLTTAGKTAHPEVTQPGATAPDSTGQQVSPSDTGLAAMATAHRDDDGRPDVPGRRPLPQSDPCESHQNLHLKTQQNQYLQPWSQQVQRRPLHSTTLEEAGRVLHQVQRQKQVLEENLEALLRARSGELLYSQLEALVDNRSQNQKVRIKKMVDTWINTLMQDIQADSSPQTDKNKRPDRKDPAVSSHQSSAHTLRGPRRGPRVAGTGRQPSTSLWVAEPDATTGRRPQDKDVEEDTPPRRPHGGARRTLKKTPYLRFSSPPSRPSKKAQPRVVERVTGVTLKSCKTQTCLAPPVSLPPQSNVVIPSAPPTAADPTHSRAVPMAIPLGRPRTDAIPGRPGTDVVPVRPGRDAIPGRPGTDVVPGHSTHQLQEVTSSRTAPPTSPVVDVATESQEEQSDAGEAPLPRLDLFEGNEELDLLPESVCDVVQVDSDEEGPLAEEVVQLDGDPSPPLVQYHGPLFPPQACVGLSDQDQTPITTCSPALEKQLLEWVEQQLISRMISEMYQPPPSDPQPDPDPDPDPDPGSDHDDSDQSAHSITSDDILIRQLVEEVLSEHINRMHQASLVNVPEPGLERPKPEPESHREEEPVCTPQPTPPPSPTPQSRTSQPLATPPPSEPSSLMTEDPPQSISAPDPVITPTPTPELSPVAADLPAAPLTPPPPVAEDAEVQLVERSAEERASAAVEEAPPAPENRAASHCSSTEDSSSSSSSTVGTEATYKAVSEGELLSHVQLGDTMTEEVLCSFSISLQDTEFDPPSEGQAGGHDHLLPNLEDSITLIEGSNQGWMMSDQQEDVSVGEVRDVHATNPGIPPVDTP